MGNCIDCGHHSIIRDDDPSDSFNYDDVAVVCTLVPNPKQNMNSKYMADWQNKRTITVACRPYNTRKESETPDWCPLNK